MPAKINPKKNKTKISKFFMKLYGRGNQSQRKAKRVIKCLNQQNI